MFDPCFEERRRGEEKKRKKGRKGGMEKMPWGNADGERHTNRLGMWREGEGHRESKGQGKEKGLMKCREEGCKGAGSMERNGEKSIPPHPAE